MRPMRWGDNDKYFWIFTLSKNSKGYNPIAFELESVGEGRRAKLRISLFGYTVLAPLPNIIPPWRERHDYVHDGIAKFYYDVFSREYGFSYENGFLRFSYGPQTHDSSTTASKGYFLPWTQWRHVRESLYDLKGECYCDLPDYRGLRAYAPREALKNSCPSVTFSFKDYDGEELTARTRIEEREWLRGEGWFKWLSAFYRPKIRRALDISFSGETGREKGSWKGGTIGSGIDMLPGELHEAAFKRYCAEHQMQFIGEPNPPATLILREGVHVRRPKVGSEL